VLTRKGLQRSYPRRGKTPGSTEANLKSRQKSITTIGDIHEMTIGMKIMRVENQAVFQIAIGTLSASVL
jgi:hypothetical protein